jgi:hypothetical protein
MNINKIIEEQLSLKQEADIELTDPYEIQRLLALIPRLIFKCEEIVQNADQALELSQDALDLAKAKAELMASSDPTLSAAQDRKAWARTRPEVVDAISEVIAKKGEVKQAQLLARKYENYFTSVRKAANIFEVLKSAEMANMKYGGAA